MSCSDCAISPNIHLLIWTYSIDAVKHLDLPSSNDECSTSTMCISLSGSTKLIREIVAICSIFCFTLSSFAQDFEASAVDSSLTSLEFVPVVNAINNIEQTTVQEQSLKFEMPVPSSGMLEEAPTGFAKEDTWRWTVQFGFGFEIDDFDNHFGLGGVGFSYFPIDDLSINVEFNGMYFVQDKAEEAAGFNFNLLLRWHYLTEEKWTAFAEMSGGIVVNDNPVPANGAGFNFIAQVGAGISVDLGDDVRLLTGIRWHHLSNARTFDRNPGMDSAFGFVGLSMPF